MIKQQIEHDFFNAIYGWGKFGVLIEENDLYNSYAFRKGLQEIRIADELEQAEKENTEDFAYCYARYEIPF